MKNKKDLLDICTDIITILKYGDNSAMILNLLDRLYEAYRIENEYELDKKVTDLFVKYMSIRTEMHNIMDELLNNLKDKVDDRKKQII
jgi:hypothetical protein